jgi:hypothetical protein
LTTTHSTPDLMIDLETLGLKPGSSVLSIGALAFDADDANMKNVRKFHAGIDLVDSLLHGLSIDVSTLQWWLDQTTAEAKRAIVDLPKRPLQIVLNEFTLFLQEVQPQRIWANGSDVAWLEAVFGRAGRAAPWDHRTVRDCRTIWEIGGVGKEDRTEPVTAHDALSDCEAQAKDVCRAWANMRPIRNVLDDSRK